MTDEEREREIAATYVLMSIGRFEKVRLVRNQLDRLVTYFEHRSVMCEIDFHQTLYNEITDELCELFDEAMDEILQKDTKGIFMAKYKLLNEKGLDAIWAPGIDLSNLGILMPWR